MASKKWFSGVIVLLLLLGLAANVCAKNSILPSSQISVSIDALGSFKAENLSFSAFQSALTPVGGGGTGKVTINDIVITKSPDSYSPDLFLYCAAGRYLSKVTINVDKISISGTMEPFMEITLSNVIVSNFSFATKTDEGSVETLNFYFGKVCIKVSDISGNENETCWNVTTNEPETP